MSFYENKSKYYSRVFNGLRVLRRLRSEKRMNRRAGIAKASYGTFSNDFEPLNEEKNSESSSNVGVAARLLYVIHSHSTENRKYQKSRQQ